MMDVIKKHWRWLLVAWIAFVFVQSLFFKFSGSYETNYIFGVLGDWVGWPWFARYGGYGVGVIELIASVMLFTRIWPWGALLAFNVITGAVFFHLFTPLGIVMPVFDDAGNIVGDDGGTLFVMACLTFIAAAVLVMTDVMSRQGQLRRVLIRKNL